MHIKGCVQIHAKVSHSWEKPCSNSCSTYGEGCAEVCFGDLIGGQDAELNNHGLRSGGDKVVGRGFTERTTQTADELSRSQLSLGARGRQKVSHTRKSSPTSLQLADCGYCGEQSPETIDALIYTQPRGKHTSSCSAAYA